MVLDHYPGTVPSFFHSVLDTIPPHLEVPLILKIGDKLIETPTLPATGPLFRAYLPVLPVSPGFGEETQIS